MTRSSEGARAGPATWSFRLYLAGGSQKGLRAAQNLRALCEARLKGRYQIDTIDLLLHPDMASADQILALPTVVRKTPGPSRKVIGDLSSAALAVKGLDLPEPPVEG